MSRFVGIDALGIGPANPDVFQDKAYADGWNAVIKILDNCLKNIPTADVAPVRHGRWLEYENDADRGYHYCSHCKRQAINYSDGGVITEVLSPYCPNCGAKMDAEETKWH